MGSDISPVCRVSIRNETQQTRVHRGTVAPWFDELFFFHDECLPSELMEDFIEFKVSKINILAFLKDSHKNNFKTICT